MRGKILAVDDEPAQLELIDVLLTEEGFDIDTAANGLEALDRIQHSRPDLILVDASMPKMNGFTLCETLRKNADTACIPIIMLSGLHTHLARLHGLAHGADAFMLKPYVADELLAKINELLTKPAIQ